jgi:branched-chain amino acid transport system substrate-binding protein
VRMADVVKLPMIGFCTGTPVVYDFHPTEFVVRPSYNDEVEKQIDELWTKHGVRKIAVIYQNDAFGAAIREAVVKDLKKYHSAPVVEASYSRKTAEVDDAVNRVHEAAPEAVIIGATSAALKEIIKKRDEQKWKTLCSTFSVGTEYLEELGKASDGIILTQVVPMMDAKLPTVELYNKLRKKYTPQAHANMTAFEAFINAMVVSEGLKRAGKDLTRDKFIKALESMKDFDLGLGREFKLTFSATNHNGLSSKSVYYTWIKDGKLTPLSEKELTALVKSAKG